MKNLLITVCLTIVVHLIFSASIHSQPPQTFNYQAVLRDNSGQLISNQNTPMRISIRESTLSGAVVYQETFNPTTNEYGLVNLHIGTGVVVSGSFSDIEWGYDNYFIQIEIDAGAGYIDMGTTQLLSVPYALHAKTSTFADSISLAGISGQTLHHNGMSWVSNSLLFNDGVNIGIGTTNPTEKFDLRGNMRLGTSSMPVLLKNTHGGGWWGFSIEIDGVQRAFVNRLGEAYIESRLGIGTTAPSAQLHTTGSVRFEGIIGTGNHLSINSSGVLERTDLSLSPSKWTEGTSSNIYRQGNVSIGTTANWGERLFIIGDGTNNPLRVQSTSGITNFLVHSNGGVTIGSGISAPPANGLLVGGGVRFTGAGSPGNGKVLTSDGTGNATWQESIQPIAIGYINSNGIVSSSSGNVSCTWNNTSEQYEITITGETYTSGNYVTVITPVCKPESFRTLSGSGQLVVVFYSSGINRMQCDFQFVTYKP